MNRENNIEELRSKANDLLKKAKQIEEKRFIQVGKLVSDYYKKDFEDFDLDQFKSKLKEIFSGAKKTRRKRTT